MKLFLSWSGDLSHEVALLLRNWIPQVIQSVEPYVSSEDIDKGTRWSTDIAKELESSFFGIICVTKDNIASPWVNFEAGALSKAIDSSKVCPLLFNIKRSEVNGPLLQFQSTVFEKEDFKKLMTSINSSLDPHALPVAVFDRSFEKWWPDLEEKINQLKATNHSESSAGIHEVVSTSESDILEEILTLVRNQQKILHSPEELIPNSYIEKTFGRLLRSHDFSRGKEINIEAVNDLMESVNIALLEIENIKDGAKPENVETLRQSLRRMKFATRHIASRIVRPRILGRGVSQMELFNPEES
jgi:hypothetical protein